MVKQRPAFKGLFWQKSQYYSFFRPTDWHEFQWADGREGIILGPNVDDPLTVFAVELTDLGMTTTPDDFDDLDAGFIEGIEQLPGYELEDHQTWVQGSIICLAAKYTYLEDDIRRKRWVRVFYQDNRQIVMTAQGATVETYDYWLPMFYEAMMTTKIHRFAPKAP
jgi:hypothetical protein